MPTAKRSIEEFRSRWHFISYTAKYASAYYVSLRRSTRGEFQRLAPTSSKSTSPRQIHLPDGPGQRREAPDRSLCMSKGPTFDVQPAGYLDIILYCAGNGSAGSPPTTQPAIRDGEAAAEALLESNERAIVLEKPFSASSVLRADSSTDHACMPRPGSRRA